MARAAGGIQRERYETEFAVRSKSAAIDLVTEVDLACERLLVETLRDERPDDAILAEEGSGDDREGATWRWVIDPLDGTMNFAHGYPRFCVSIGVQHLRETQVAAVYDPLLDELFAAQLAAGATRNGRPIRVSDQKELGRSLLSTGFAYDVHVSEDDNLASFARFAKLARGLRRDGSAALDLCYVACGRFDAFWERKLHPWDVCAGNLIVSEAGGRNSDFSGAPAVGDGRETLASNGHLHTRMLEVLGESFAG
ncbi:MAG: inositol monophosphatase [Myxococcales bacterium]|nr:inositol monophosphatase [Myxococcales bacterium]